jgi:replicative DNA helicase
MEETVLQNLMINKRFFAKSFSYLDQDLFNTPENAVIFSLIKEYVTEHTTKPSLKEIGLTLKESNKISGALKDSSLNKFKELARDVPIENIDFLLSKTETWVQKQKLTKSIFKAADIIQSDGAFEPIIGMVEDALQVSFNSDTGLSYLDSVKDRADYYHRKIQGISTGIPSLDHLLGGGFMKKTLSLVSAPSHGGKSALLACMTANMVVKKQNILYITLEMSEEETAKRIDANILDIDINEFKRVKEEVLVEKFNKVKDNFGELIIKEYPAGTFNVLHLEALMSELENKDFEPDIIMIDYLGLMASSRTSLQQPGGTYMYVKTIAEECHGFSKKYDIPVVSAAQLNRSAFGNTEVGMENISESIGLAATADVMLAMIATEQMRDLNQVQIKFLKNRNTGRLDSTLLETDYPKMRYTDYDEGDSGTQSTQDAITLNNMSTGMDFGSINF